MNSTFLDILNIVLITGVVYGLVFSAVVLLSKKRKGRPLLFLNFLVLSITLNNLQTWLIGKELVSTFIYIKYLRVPWYFLCMPMFYVFLVHYLKIHNHVRSFLMSTIFIFIGTILIRLILIYYMHSNNFDEEHIAILLNIRYNKFEEILSFIYTLIILVYLIRTYRRNRKIFEFALNYDDLKWIRDFLFVAVTIVFAWFLAIALHKGKNTFNDPIVYTPLRMCTTILIYWIGFKGLFRYRIMEDRIVLRENINRDRISKVPFTLDLKQADIDTSKKTSDKQLKLFERIDNFVKKQQKYLLPDISLESLAEEVNMSAGHLSHLINTYSDFNFSDYINQLRVDQSKRLIMDAEFINYTIVAIGLESGFNSKSTFYTAFKKFTQLSPSEFKAKHALRSRAI